MGEHMEHNTTSRAIFNITKHVIYPSVSAAAAALGVTRRAIQINCNNMRGKTKGYRLTWYNIEEHGTDIPTYKKEEA
jgi:hypothetical protein